MRLAFVTPAYRRYELTAICLEQRRRVIEELAAYGIEAHQVVVADDENLDVARALGSHTVEQDNEFLGRRFNDGWEYAFRTLGADWVAPIGSDSWVKPEVFDHDWSPRKVYTAPHYAVVDQRGEWVLVTHVGRGGAGPHVYHRSWAERLTRPFRPARENLQRGIDSSTAASIFDLGRPQAPRSADRPPTWCDADTEDEFQYVGFRSELNITPYEKLAQHWGVREEEFSVLYDHYPHDLVGAVARFYSDREAARV